MKRQWLYMAIILSSCGFLNNFYGRAAVCLLWLLILPHIVNREVHKKMLIIMILFFVFSIPLKSKAASGRVVAMRDNYMLVRSGLSQFIIYSQDPEVGIDDIVEIDCELEAVDSYDNFEASTFKSWAFSQQIYYQGSIDRFRILKKALTIRRALYELNKDNWISRLLFAKGFPDSDYRFILTSTGMHISFMISLVRKFLNYGYYPDESLKKTINLTVLLGLIFKFPYAYVRVLLSLLAELFIEDKRDRAGWMVCMLCLYRPYMIKSLSFLMPVGIKILNLLLKKHKTLLINVWMLMLQLYFYGCCDLLGVLSFNLFRSIAGCLYTLACGLSMLPFKMDVQLDRLLRLRESLPSFILNGRISVLLAAVMVTALFRYSLSSKIKYLLLIFLCLLANSFQSLFRIHYEVNYLDVGQGDCAVICQPFSGKALLIDTGGNKYKDISNDIVIPFLRSRGISSVDVIISHDDFDHCGALETLMNGFRVENVYSIKKDVRLGRLEVSCLLKEHQFADKNSNSLISYFSISGFGFLFLGDIGSDAEELLVNTYQHLPVAVLKLAHHGSASSSSEKLLANYQASYGIISAGRNNRYRHPSFETLKRLNDYQVNVLNTQSDHGIKFRIFKYFMIYQTAGGKSGICFNRMQH